MLWNVLHKTMMKNQRILYFIINSFVNTFVGDSELIKLKLMNQVDIVLIMFTKTNYLRNI